MTITNVAFATKHGKESVVGHVFENALGWEIRHIECDTDQFGTFSGEVERPYSAEQTARLKALAGIELSGIPRGIASEGTIGPHPAIPVIVADVEVMVYVDRERGYDIVERYVSSDIVAIREQLTNEQMIDDVVFKADLPRHAVILRHPDSSMNWVRKGLTDVASLTDAYREFTATFPGSSPAVESDFRAMHSPSRMRNIERCATQLALRLAQACPGCAAPGWGVTKREFGRVCSGCGFEVAESPKAEVFSCGSCSYREHHPVEPVMEDPARCSRCNP